MVERQSGNKLQFLHTDGGKEYTGESLTNTISTFLKNSGIQHDTTPSYSSSSNGTAERLNCTLFDMARPMMIKSKLSSSFWAEAINTANKIRNRLPTKSLPNYTTPHEAWFGNKPSIKHLRQFGCIAFHRLPDEIITKGQKISPRSIKCCLVGYIGNRIYRLWDPTQKKIIVSRDVVFKENEFFHISVFGNIPISQHTFQTPFDDNVLDDEDPDLGNFIIPDHPARPQYLPASSSGTQTTPSPNRFALLAPIPPVPSNNDNDSDSDDDDIPDLFNADPGTPEALADPPASPTPIPAPAPAPHVQANHPLPQEPSRRSERNRQLTERKAEADAGAKVTKTGPSLHTPSFAPPQEPTSVKEALHESPQSQQWYQATIRELDSLQKNNTWTLVPHPADRNVIKTKYIYKLKDPETQNPCYKVRLVAQGFAQQPGEDYDDTFSPVAKPTSVRLIFALAAGRSLHAHHFDVETAFLIPSIDRTIYVEQPPEFEDPKHPRTKFVCKLNKGLYGLNQSALLWSNDVKSKLLKLGYRQSDADESIFILQEADQVTIIAVYVDDFLVLANSIERINHLNSQLSQTYTIRDLGPIKRFLGLDIHRPTPTGNIYISQSTYSRKILHRFGMENCNPLKAPFPDSTQLHKRTDDEEPTDSKLYREIIGSIGFLPMYTRPDLAFAVSKLSQYLSNPSVIHMQAAKHVLRYIKGTLDYS